jgi:hypothetical protein
MARLPEIRSAHLERFMKAQSLSTLEIEQRVWKLYPSARNLLFVSSIVQGLGGSTSDIDVIVTVEQDTPADMMTHHMFLGSWRVGVTVYAVAQMQRALEQMTELAQLELPSLLRSWRALLKVPHAVPEQELERAVNGVTVQATMPFSPFLPALCSVWTARSFDEFRQGVVCALLSQRAGELRAPRAYLSYAVRYLMDAVLSHHGDVYWNEKWFLLRWERAQSDLRAQPTSLAEQINALWQSIRSGEFDLRNTAQVDSLQSLMFRAAEVFGYSKWVKIALPTYALAGAHGRLVPNTLLWLAGPGNKPFLSDESAAREASSIMFADLTALAPGEARAILTALRIGRANCSIAGQP